MTRKCEKCGWVATSMTKKKNRCCKCGGQTVKFRTRKLKDVDGYYPPKDDD